MTENFLVLYQKPTQTAWQGRIDGTDWEALRWHQVVQPLNLLEDIKPLESKNIGIALLGFASDEGVRRNMGRVGAAAGAEEIRKACANLPVSFQENFTLADAGTIACIDTNLEAAQETLAEAVTKLLNANYFPLLLGGGHEIAFAHFNGIRNAVKNLKPKVKIGIINFDAHFDLREIVENVGASSGTPFRQIADLVKKNGEDFCYFCLGIQHSSNTKKLFDTAKSLNVHYVEAFDFYFDNIFTIESHLQKFADNVDYLYISLDMDVFSSAFAPGVSAPNTIGMLPNDVKFLLETIMQKQKRKVLAMDIAEVSPPYDLDSRTAKLAAHFAFNMVDMIANEIRIR